MVLKHRVRALELGLKEEKHRARQAESRLAQLNDKFMEAMTENKELQERVASNYQKFRNAEREKEELKRYLIAMEERERVSSLPLNA